MLQPPATINRTAGLAYTIAQPSNAAGIGAGRGDRRRFAAGFAARFAAFALPTALAFLRTPLRVVIVFAGRFAPFADVTAVDRL